MDVDYLKTLWKREEEAAHIHGWDFSHIRKCFQQLLKMQEMLEKDGKIEGTIHRYLIIAEK